MKHVKDIKHGINLHLMTYEIYNNF